MNKHRHAVLYDVHGQLINAINIKHALVQFDIYNFTNKTHLNMDTTCGAGIVFKSRAPVFISICSRVSVSPVFSNVYDVVCVCGLSITFDYPFGVL